MVRLLAPLVAVAITIPAVQATFRSVEDAVDFLVPNLCCTVLSLSGLKVLYPKDDEYNTRLSSYFSEVARLKPNCIVRPTNTEQVSRVVKVLDAASIIKPCEFAIRSGGHTPYAGASSIAGGVTIDLQQLNSVTYNAAKKTTTVQPGAQWTQVYQELQPRGVMVAGGRSSTVGVGGLTLGGGISYYSGRMGFVCDNIVEFEVVLANGTITTANKSKNADLYAALKGGSNNFAVVTKLEITTFEAGQLWGGLVLYPDSTADQHYQAMSNFANNMESDPDASAIVMNLYMSSVGTPFIINSYEYTKPTPRPAAHAEFLAIQGNISDTTRVTSLTDLAKELEAPPLYRVSFLTLTFKNDIRVMQKAGQLFNSMIATLKAQATGQYTIYCLHQPLPKLFHKDSAAKGGNMLGLERFDENLILYQPYISWTGADQDALFQGEGEKLIKGIREFAASIGKDNEFLYLDYADKTQDPLTGYGAASLEKMRAVAKKYDPEQVFQKRVPGGFKLSKAGK